MRVALALLACGACVGELVDCTRAALDAARSESKQLRAELEAEKRKQAAAALEQLGFPVPKKLRADLSAARCAAGTTNSECSRR